MTKIDWSALHHRLESVRARPDQELAITPVERSRILKARARALAEEQTIAEEGESIEVVEFLLAHEKYAIESVYIREVYLMKQLTPVPCTPPFILGLVNVRGQILTVIDMKKFFDLPERGLSDLNKVIILHGKNTEFGLLADNVLGMRKVALDALRPALPTLAGIRKDYLKGIAQDRVAVLDARALLEDEKIMVREEAV